MQPEQKDLIAKVLHESHLGGSATSYTVHHTAERVMLVFGVLIGSHREMLKNLISRETNNVWTEDDELANLVGAELALGFPESITSLKERLASAGAINSCA